MKQIRVGKIKLKNPLVLAPMLEITNLPYRLICREQGAALAFTEMIYIDALLHKNKKTQEMLKTCKKDSPLGIQVTGNNPEEFKKAIPILKKFQIVDLNCGCPSTRILGNKAGSYLLEEPEKISEIIKILKSAGLTVTAKIRLGFSKNNALKIAKTIEKAGADALTVHARLATQSYEIPADWSEIKKIKNSIKIPVIGNGDVLSPEKAKEMLNYADAVMIGRGAIGNPPIFKNSLKCIKTGKFPETNIKQNLILFQKYLKFCKKYRMSSIQNAKHLATHFIKGIRNASSYRNQIMQLKTIKDIENFIQQISVN